MFVTHAYTYHARMIAYTTNPISLIRVLIIYNYKREYREKLKQKCTKAVNATQQLTRFFFPSWISIFLRANSTILLYK